MHSDYKIKTHNHNFKSPYIVVCVELTFGKNLVKPTSRSKHSKLAFLSSAVAGISRNILLISRQHNATAVSKSSPDSNFFCK